jgi:hypothetical protein
MDFMTVIDYISKVFTATTAALVFYKISYEIYINSILNYTNELNLRNFLAIGFTTANNTRIYIPNEYAHDIINRYFNNFHVFNTFYNIANSISHSNGLLTT